MTPTEKPAVQPKTTPTRFVRKKAVSANVLAKTVSNPEVEKLEKEKKPKLVRDKFSIPESEFSVLKDLKQRAEKLSSKTKKNELIRAGIKSMAKMSDADFLAALETVQTIKKVRPA